MLLWVIIKTTDNGAKCLLTGLAIILRNQDRWEHYKLQINLFNNEGPSSVLAGDVYCYIKQAHGVLGKDFSEILRKNETQYKEKCLTLSTCNQEYNPCAMKMLSNKLGPFSVGIHAWLKSKVLTWITLMYSACLTRTNGGRPSAYMLTAVSCPHPGNDCVINPKPFFKLLLTAGGENGVQTVSAHLSPKTCWGWFDPDWLLVTFWQRRSSDWEGLYSHKDENPITQFSITWKNSNCMKLNSFFVFFCLVEDIFFNCSFNISFALNSLYNSFKTVLRFNTCFFQYQVFCQISLIFKVCTKKQTEFKHKIRA